MLLLLWRDGPVPGMVDATEVDETIAPTTGAGGAPGVLVFDVLVLLVFLLLGSSDVLEPKSWLDLCAGSRCVPDKGSIHVPRPLNLPMSRAALSPRFMEPLLAEVEVPSPAW